MESVWIITEFCRDVTGHKGTYSWHDGFIVAVCNSKDQAVSVASEHIKRQIEDARQDAVMVDDVEIYNGEPTADELACGVTCMKVTESVEPHNEYEYGIKITKWMVIDE